MKFRWDQYLMETISTPIILYDSQGVIRLDSNLTHICSLGGLHTRETRFDGHVVGAYKQSRLNHIREGFVAAQFS